jgi:acetylornithine deacetylase/succinyl-diaminopimelate desuccinylase-like protein
VAFTRLRCRRLPRFGRISDTGRRRGHERDRAALVAADGRDQRHLRRLYRARQEDRHPGARPAKLSFRLVPHQQPAQILNSLHRFIEERLPKDCIASFADEGGSPAVGFDTSAPVFKAATHALAQEWGKPPLIIGRGASIPIVEAFRSRLGLECLLVGFALDDDRIHSPNEKYNVKSFTKGARSWARLLGELGTIDGHHGT